MSTVTMFIRLGVSMGVVLAVMMVAARIMKSRAGKGLVGRSPKSGLDQIEVLSRRSLSKNASVAVVKAADRTLVLGVTDHTVTVLAEGPTPDSDAGTSERSKRERTIRLPILDLPAASGEVNGEGRMPAPAGANARSSEAWKLAFDSLRERTVRR